MYEKKIVLIARAPQYSLNSVDKDWEILSAVRRQLLLMGCCCEDIVHEEQMDSLPAADVYLSMGRLDRTLTMLHDRPLVINSSASIDLCKHRSRLMHRLEQAGFPVPPLEGHDGYWVKRGDDYTMCEQDVQYAADEAQALLICQEMQHCGITAVDVRSHVQGHLLKCYGVAGTSFFHCHHPADAPCPAFDSSALHHLLSKVAALVGLTVYGCDCIIRADGSPVIIDVNDWPSFSPCLDEAAVAIAQSVMKRDDGDAA